MVGSIGMPPKTSEDFDWVRARDRCSIEEAFGALRLAVKQVMATRNRLSGSEPFVFSENGALFSVTRKADAAAVDFRLAGRYIRITGHGIVAGRGAVETRLDDDGRCVLFLDGAQARRWRITNYALDVLFFGEGSDRPR